MSELALIALFPCLVLIILYLRNLPFLSLVIKGTLRMSVQLLMVGIVLGWVFKVNNSFLTFFYLVLMTIAGAYVAFERQPKPYPRMLLHILTAMTIATWATTSASVIVLNGPDGLLSPDKVIPMLGITLGNMLNGFVLGFRELTDMGQNKIAMIETRLSLGASLDEAILPHFKEALEKALIPVTNAMLSAGVVSLPGVLVGQLAAGAEPLRSCLYQMVVLTAILFATTSGILLVFSMSKRKLFDHLDA